MSASLLIRSSEWRETIAAATNENEGIESTTSASYPYCWVTMPSN